MTLHDFRLATQNKSWLLLTESLLKQASPTMSMSTQFATYWIEGGHHIREQLADDGVLLLLLQLLLPPYNGEALTLYRGENLSRWRSGQVGFAWTKDVGVARMFGAGLNAVHSGGILLKGRFEPQRIISAPNVHSLYLAEAQYTINPFGANEIEEMEFFPPS